MTAPLKALTSLGWHLIHPLQHELWSGALCSEHCVLTRAVRAGGSPIALLRGVVPPIPPQASPFQAQHHEAAGSAHKQPTAAAKNKLAVPAPSDLSLLQ